MHPNKNNSRITWANYYVPCSKEIVDRELQLGGRRHIGPPRRGELQRLGTYADDATPGDYCRRLGTVSACKHANDAVSNENLVSAPTELDKVERCQTECGLNESTVNKTEAMPYCL